MGWREAWGRGPELPSPRLQALAWKVEEAILDISDWLGNSCMSGSASHAHTGCMLTGVSRLDQRDSWCFRAIVGVDCGHSQLLQYLKWLNNTQEKTQNSK